MFNPHIHQHQQQQHQQQLHQHLRQLQQLFQQQQQQPPPPPPPQPPPAHHVAHHHQTPRAIPVPPQTAPPPRMVNLCQATQTTIIGPNPMLQGALLMQQMQGSMRGFGMGGQQFRQFFAAGTRSSLLGPVPMGMAIKSPIVGFPAARPYHPHARFFNTTATTTASSSSSSSISTTDTSARITDRKRDNEQMATGSTEDQPAAVSGANEDSDKTQADADVGRVDEPISDEQLEEPAVKRQKTEGSENPDEQGVVETETTAPSECNSSTDYIPPEACSIQEEDGSSRESDVVEALEETRDDQAHSCLASQSPSGGLGEEEQLVDLPVEETPQPKDASLASPEPQDEEEEGVAEGSNKFYCYLCSITCYNQQNFRSHMNSISHQQRMMEIQYMSNACLVTLLPRVQESLQGANKDGERKADSKRWCATCNTHFTCSIMDHHRSEEHKLASSTDVLSCTICKKRFKTSQNFLQHLHSHEHRQKLQEKGSEALAKLTAMDTDGFSLEEGDGGVEDGEDRQRSEGDQDQARTQSDFSLLQDGWASVKEVTLNDMASDEQYDPETVYGSSFLVPVAGFICRLCNKFYHFDSSAVHTHCKSLKHFENLGVSWISLPDFLWSEYFCAYCSVFVLLFRRGWCFKKAKRFSPQTANLNSMQPTITVTQPETQKEIKLEEQREETDLTSQDLTISAISSGNLNKDLSLPHEEEDNESSTSAAQETPVGSREEATSVPTATPEDSNEEEQEKDAPAGPGKRHGAGKAKAPATRRSGRVTNRR
ncbi:cdkn1a interacting zinc finger protein 1a [Xenentodon cancila]